MFCLEFIDCKQKSSSTWVLVAAECLFLFLVLVFCFVFIVDIFMFCLEFIDCKEHLGFGGGRGADQDQDQDCATWWQNYGLTETRELIVKILKKLCLFFFISVFDFGSKYSMFLDQVFFCLLTANRTSSWAARSQW